jgi:hypothetical protein
LVVTVHVTPRFCASFVTAALKPRDSPSLRVADEGVIVMETPEMIVIVAVADAFVSAWETAFSEMVVEELGTVEGAV